MVGTRSAMFCKRVVESRVLPFVVDRRRPVGDDDRVVAGVGRVARGVLDREVRPRAGDDHRLGAEPLEQRLEIRVVEGVHAHLLDDEIPLLRLEALHRRGAPRATNDGARGHSLEEGRVQLETRRALVDDVPDVDHRHAGGASRGCDRLDVRDHLLALGVLGGPGPVTARERAPGHDHVVLEVLDDQRALLRVEPYGHRSLLFETCGPLGPRSGVAAGQAGCSAPSACS